MRQNVDIDHENWAVHSRFLIFIINIERQSMNRSPSSAVAVGASVIVVATFLFCDGGGDMGSSVVVVVDIICCACCSNKSTRRQRFSDVTLTVVIRMLVLWFVATAR